MAERVINSNNLLGNLKYLSTTGSILHRKIALQLIEMYASNEVESVSKVKTFAEYFNISYSSVTRFINKLGYPSFKHFSYIFSKNADETIYQINNHQENYNLQIHQESKLLAEKIKGKIYILSSRRGKAIGKLLHERLNDGQISNCLFSEKNDEIKSFVQKSSQGTLLLISVSGFSYLFSQAIEKIAEMNHKPNVVILTAAKWMKIFENYNYMSISKLQQKTFDSASWNDYNNCLIEISKIAMEILNIVYENKKSRNI